MSETDVLLDELRRGYDGDPWHGSSARAILDDITAREAAARPIPDAHTIWEILLHATAWSNEVSRRLATGVGAAAPEEGDWPPVGETTDAAWQATRRAHEETHRRLVTALDQFPSERASERFGTERNPAAGSGVTYTVMLHGLAQHDAYHMGQISLLKKALRGAG